jgi:hypothetical protein
MGAEALHRSAPPSLGVHKADVSGTTVASFSRVAVCLSPPMLRVSTTQHCSRPFGRFRRAQPSAGNAHLPLRMDGRASRRPQVPRLAWLRFRALDASARPLAGPGRAPAELPCWSIEDPSSFPNLVQIGEGNRLLGVARSCCRPQSLRQLSPYTIVRTDRYFGDAGIW